MRTLFNIGTIILLQTFSSFALADGLIGGAINQVLPGVGTQLDNANRQLKQAIPPYKQLDDGASAAARHLGSEIMAQVGGVPLDQWIVQSRNSAINGSMPIPPLIRQELTGYASEYSLNTARYKIGDNGFFNLANVLERGGFASAVTLIDVIIFRGPSEADNRSTWAHELTHVDQYHDWGVHSFAIQYSRDYNSVESPAYAKGNGYGAWAQHQNISPSLPASYPAPFAPGQQNGMGHFCVVAPPNGPPSVRDMGQLYPVGSLCANNPFWGTVR
jgi:uncharacterized protein DUF4157